MGKEVEDEEECLISSGEVGSKGRRRRRRRCVVVREVDECLNRFGEGGGGIWRLCYIGKRHLFTRV